MRIISGNLFFAPSDLIAYMESALASHLERHRLADPGIKDLMNPEDLMLKTLQKEGYEHEDSFLKSLKAEGRDVVEIENASPDVMQSHNCVEFNYQVNMLRAALDPNAKVGSVDKFQGQEAPIVIVSMCASDASESPRGIEFLFSKNRLNVAISRVYALAIIVGSPGLGTTPVGNLRQMEIVNFLI